MNNRGKKNAGAYRPHTGKYLSTDGRRGRKRKTHRRGAAVLWAVGLALLILAIVLIILKCAPRDRNTELVGVWRYDAYTEYSFWDGSRGCMYLDGNTHYDFSYSIQGNTLSIDFVLEYVTDCQYTYTLNGSRLTLVGGEGTAEVGKVYELTKKTE